MKKKLFLLIYLFISTFSFSQQAKIDSLKIAFQKSKIDKERLYILKLIAQESFYLDSNLYKTVSDSILSFALDIGNKEYEAVGNNALGRYYHKIGNSKKSKEFYLNAVHIYNDIKDDNGIAMGYGNIASMYVDINNIDSALYYLNKAIPINKKNNTFINLFYNYYNLGIAHSTQNNSKEAIANLLIALNYAEKINNERHVAYCLGMIGVIYLEQEMYNEAENYFYKAISVFSKLDDSFGLAQQYVNLGKLFNESENQFFKAINNYKKAVLNYNKIGDSINAYTAISNIGRNFLQLAKIDSARIYLEKSFEFSEKSNNPDELVRLLTNLGEIDYKERKYKKAKAKILRSIEIASEHNFKEDYAEALLLLSDINAAEGDYRNAYKNISNYHYITDSIKSFDTKEMIVEITTKYQTEKKEKENLFLKQQNAEQKIAVQKATILSQRYSFIALTAVLGIIGIFYYSKTRRRKQRDEHIINIAKTKQKEHEKIGADLHSTKTKDLEKIASALEEKGETVIASKVRDVKDSIRFLSHELFQIPFSQSEFDNQIINLLFEYNSESLKITHQGIHTIPWPQVDDTIKRNLYLIISEAISNIKNHSGASEANLKFQKNNQNIDVTITDNGKGFSDEDLKNGHGIGNMRMRVNEIKGSIRFNAVKDKGSEIGIFITAF